MRSRFYLNNTLRSQHIPEPVTLVLELPRASLGHAPVPPALRIPLLKTPILPREVRPQHQRKQGIEEHEGRTDTHALDEVRLLTFGEDCSIRSQIIYHQRASTPPEDDLSKTGGEEEEEEPLTSRAQQWPSLADDIQQRDAGAALRVAALVINRPRQDVGNTREHASGRQEHGEIAHRHALARGEDDVPDASHEREPHEHRAALLGPVRDPGRRHADDEGHEIGRRAEPLGVDGREAQVLEDHREEHRQAAERNWWGKKASRVSSR